MKGIFLQDLNKLEQSLACYSDAIRIDPNFAAVHFNRGHCLHELNRTSEAIASYNEAFRIDPNFAVFLNYRKLILNEKNQFVFFLNKYKTK